MFNINIVESFISRMEFIENRGRGFEEIIEGFYNLIKNSFFKFLNGIYRMFGIVYKDKYKNCGYRRIILD